MSLSPFLMVSLFFLRAALFASVVMRYSNGSDCQSIWGTVESPSGLGGNVFTRSLKLLRDLSCTMMCGTFLRCFVCCVAGPRIGHSGSF